MVRKLLYRDTRVQHADVARAQAVHDDAHKSIEKQTKAFRPKDPKLSAELIFSEACTKFLRDRSCENPGQVFSIAEKFFMPLILRPASIHRPVHAPGIVASGHKNEIVISVLSNSGSQSAPMVSAMHDSACESLLVHSLIEASWKGSSRISCYGLSQTQCC